MTLSPLKFLCLVNDQTTATEESGKWMINIDNPWNFNQIGLLLKNNQTLYKMMSTWTMQVSNCLLLIPKENPNQFLPNQDYH